MNENSRTAHTIRNLVAGFGAQGAGIVLPFVVRTIIIYKLGAEYSGMGSLFSSILQALSVADLGFSSAVTFCLYKPVAEKNYEEIGEWLAIYRFIYRLVGAAILVGGLCTVPFLPKLIKGTYPSDINLYAVYLIFLVNSVISYFAFSYKEVLLIADQRRDILNKVYLLVSVAKSTIQIIVLLVTANYYLFIVLVPICTIASNLIVNNLVKKRYPEIMVKRKADIERFKTISHQIGGAAIGRIAYVARNSFDSIIISALCGLVAVTIYSNYYYIFSSVSAVLATFVSSMSASVGNSLALESSEKNYRVFCKLDFLYMWIVCWFTACLFSLYQPFMHIWVGEKLTASSLTMVLFVIYFFVNQLAQVRGIYSEAAGLWWKFRYITIGEVVANIILNVVLGYYWEINGILVATIITAFFSSYIGITLITFKHLFKKSTKEYYLNNIVYLFTTILCSFVCYECCEKLSFFSFGNNFFIKVLICIIVPNGVIAIIYCLIPKYRNYLVEMVVMIRNICRDVMKRIKV